MLLCAAWDRLMCGSRRGPLVEGPRLSSDAALWLRASVMLHAALDKLTYGTRRGPLSSDPHCVFKCGS